ncbi:hypothetical protein ADUPG1_014141 [Aduncisulcus paluster]|uniref:Uncharacterized protein n=1 Tax=Aduncisulcus paluster TaxID=2918883 RepID=A0ABQ5KAW7_9EUKA|nr:hypothetical protein ADUPG1_014141 [Aduncisulcus paluster]
MLEKGCRFERATEYESVLLSHLSIPFSSPSHVKGAYICVGMYHVPRSLLFIFSDSDGKRVCKKYEFVEPENLFIWFFLPINLLNVVLCEIEGKGTWSERNSRCFEIYSLVFTMPDESEIIDRYSQDITELSVSKDEKEKESEE